MAPFPANFSARGAVTDCGSRVAGCLAGGQARRLKSLPISTTKNCCALSVIVPAVDGMLDVKRSECFKSLPGHERHYAPESEYIFKAVQPSLEDVLALGGSYERLFDTFEVLLALVYADTDDASTGRLWGPIGRFGWKYSSRFPGVNNPFSQLRKRRRTEKNQMATAPSGIIPWLIRSIHRHL